MSLSDGIVKSGCSVEYLTSMGFMEEDMLVDVYGVLNI